MNFRTISTTVLLVGAVSTYSNARQSLGALVDRELPGLVSTYKMLHAAPELSHHEEHTSSFLAKELRSAGFQVTDHFGKYDNARWTGYGLVAVMKNGSGPTVLVRTELDGLPVEEKTGLPYASTVTTKDDAGQEVHVMHACGHDIHMTSFLGTAKTLAQLKDRWHGTLILIGQPAEETIDGAAAMLNDGLYTRFPRPDFALALHDNSDLAAGMVGYVSGYAMSSSTSVDITVRGLGGHGSRPEATKDPIVTAAQIVLALQTIVSREMSPFDPAVVTVGSIHGGSKNNIIPDEVKLQLTVRAYREEVQKKILASITRITNDIALAAGIPPERAPLINIGESTDATYNDPALTERIAGAMKKVLGDDHVLKLNPEMVSEDFCHYGLQNHQIPILQFRLGAIDPARIAKSKETGTSLPSLHSSLFEPLPEPTIRTGILAMTSAVLDLMSKGK